MLKCYSCECVLCTNVKRILLFAKSGQLSWADAFPGSLPWNYRYCVNVSVMAYLPCSANCFFISRGRARLHFNVVRIFQEHMHEEHILKPIFSYRPTVV